MLKYVHRSKKVRHGGAHLEPPEIRRPNSTSKFKGYLDTDSEKPKIY